MAVQPELELVLEVTSETGSYSPWWLLQGTARGISEWLKNHKVSEGQVKKIAYYKLGDDGSTPLFQAEIKHGA